MDDDFNTPEALAVLFDLAREINRVRDQDPNQAAALAAELRHLGGLLGILQDDADRFLKSAIDEKKTIEVGVTAKLVLSDQKIEELIGQRQEARKSKNWAEADRIRDQLQEAGVLLEDGAGGTSWRRG